MAVEDDIDLSNPESHCNQAHDHYNIPPGWPGASWGDGDWRGFLNWARGDHGYNEGAAEGARIAAKYELGLPDFASGLIGGAIGNLWDRTNMMNFAIDLAKSGNIQPAMGIAIASQWHNCHCLKCFAFHVPEIGIWLTQQ